MLVRDVMTPHPVTISPDDSLKTAVERMHNVGRRLPVVQDGKLVGIITDRDLRLEMNSPHTLRERWQDDYLLEHTPVECCMTPEPIAVHPDAPLAIAIEQMLAGYFSGLPVVDDDHEVVGIITVTDVMRAFLKALAVEEPQLKE